MLSVVAIYFAGFKLGQSQTHQRIADAWHEIFGEETEAEATEMLTDELQNPIRQDPFGEDPFGPSNANDPFATNLGPFRGDDVSGNGDDLPEPFKTTSAK